MKKLKLNAEQKMMQETIFQIKEKEMDRSSEEYRKAFREGYKMGYNQGFKDYQQYGNEIKAKQMSDKQ